MAINEYQYQAEELVREYLLADSFLPYISILGGIFLCKMAYEFTRFTTFLYFRGYSSLTKIQCIEWNNRGMSSIHAIFITLMSVYLVFFSDLFSNDLPERLITFSSSKFSISVLGISVGYFISDLALIFWLYPSLGGLEYVVHHLLSAGAITYTMLSGEGQFYTYLVLISEITTPGVNVRWFLDTAGMKRSILYLINGILVFFCWLIARIFLFGFLFCHIYWHYDQVERMHTAGYLIVFLVPSALGVMNLVWFGKILRGMMKTLAKRQ